MDTITVIQCFVRVRCLVRYCTDCEVNCNMFTEFSYQIYILYLHFLLWQVLGTTPFKPHTCCTAHQYTIKHFYSCTRSDILLVLYVYVFSYSTVWKSPIFSGGRSFPPLIRYATLVLSQSDWPQFKCNVT